MSNERCFFFGCAERSGRNMFGSRMQPPTTFEERNRASYYGGTEYISVDGTLAPRLARPDAPAVLEVTGRQIVDVFWLSLGKTAGARQCIYESTDEYPEGEFLLHHLDNGFTAIAWWDRCQGDDREGANSVVLLEGKHTMEDMMQALSDHFPQVAINLNAAGIALVEVPSAAVPKPPPPKPKPAAPAPAAKPAAPAAKTAPAAPAKTAAPAPKAPPAPAAKKS